MPSTPGARRRGNTTYEDETMRGMVTETPWVSDVLRLFECSACCADRGFDESDFKAGLRPDNLWDQEEEPVALSRNRRGAEPDSPAAQPWSAASPLPEDFPRSPGAATSHRSRAASGFDHVEASASSVPSRGRPVSFAPTVSGGSYADDQLEERGPEEVEGGYVYAGQWRGGVRHGQGILERADGVRYVGSFLGGRAHGRGVFTGADGSSYDGEWDQDHMHGFGKYVDVDGSTYEGEWANDAKSGRGIECYADGARYEGEFWMGGKHGAGIYRSGTGIEYEGQYAHDKMDGEGRYKFADGRAYSGQWTAGHMQGFGRMTWPNGSRYEGGYQQDKKHGEGTFKWPDGRTFVGHWRHGQLDGKGLLVHADGQEETQEWINGQRVAEILHSHV